MVYLDYAANTPVDERVMQVFRDVTMEHYGNPNGQYLLGKQAGDVIDRASEHIKKLLHGADMEVVYTSGASEANNLAIKGVARAYRENGKHIISTCLEHSSVSGALIYLQSIGYEIDLVDIDENGQVDLNHLKELMRSDTVLVSVCFVDSELGSRQPVEAISRIVSSCENCFFHVDATQAVGKIPVRCDGIDLLTFAPHKFYGLNGTGILMKREELVLEPLIHGGKSTSIYRSGTPVPAFAAATSEALDISTRELEERSRRVAKIRQKLLDGLLEFPLVRLNSTKESIPHFINVSVKGVKASLMQQALDEKGVCISPKSACSTPNTPSRAVYAVTKERKNAMYSFRISLSHLLTDEDTEACLDAFAACYRELTA